MCGSLRCAATPGCSRTARRATGSERRWKMVYERSPDSWVARVTIDGRQIWLGTHRTKEEAEAAVIRAGKGDLPPTITVEHWAAKWQLIYPGNRNPETNRQTQVMVAPFTRAYARRRLSDITPLMAQSWAVTHPGQVR